MRRRPWRSGVALAWLWLAGCRAEPPAVEWQLAVQDRVAVLRGAIGVGGGPVSPAEVQSGLAFESVPAERLRIDVDARLGGVVCALPPGVGSPEQAEVTHYLIGDGRGPASDYGVYGLFGAKNGIEVPWPDPGARGWESRSASAALRYQLALAKAGDAAIRIVSDNERMFFGSSTSAEPRRRIVLVVRASMARHVLPSLVKDVSCLLVALEVVGR